MKLKPTSLLPASKRYAIATGLAAAGLLLIWYGFELVSVPHVREHLELVYIALGGVALAAGGGYGVIGLKGLRPRKSAPSKGAQPEQA